LALAARAVELAPDHPAVLDTWGWLLVASGRAEESVAPLRRAAGLAPGTPEIQYHLGHALAKAGRAEESSGLLKELLRNHAAFPSRGEAEALLETL
jgi:predicted Zn-dependent protease